MKMAQIVTEVMGDQLYVYDPDKPFPSPEDLKNKFLLKGDRTKAHEKSHGVLEGNASNDEDEDEDETSRADVGWVESSKDLLKESR